MSASSREEVRITTGSVAKRESARIRRRTSSPSRVGKDRGCPTFMHGALELIFLLQAELRLLCSALARGLQLDSDPQVVGAVGLAQRFVERDQAPAVQVVQRLVEGSRPVLRVGL